MLFPTETFETRQYLVAVALGCDGSTAFKQYDSTCTKRSKGASIISSSTPLGLIASMQIETLELQIQAYAAFTSHIQGRLLAALDAINDLKSIHTRELASTTQTNAKLVRKLARYQEKLNTVDIERDDLRDAVVQLVEKGEVVAFLS